MMSQSQVLGENRNRKRESYLNNVQNFVLKVYIVITSKVFADFCFESPISIDFQSEILALLRPKSAKTFHESLQILSPLRKSAQTFILKVLADFRGESICRLSWKVFADFGGNNYTEFRFESPISISKLNNYSDFGRKSENYFNVKIFSDSRPKSAQKLILKVFADYQTEIICRLSEFFKNKICRYILVRVGYASLKFFGDRKKSLGKWIHRSVVSVSTNSTFLIEGYSVRLSLFWSIKVKGLDLDN